MKQKIFTLIILLALVVAGGKAFGQDKWTPIASSTWNYTVGSLPTNGDGYVFSVNQSTTVPGGDEGCSITAGGSGTVASNAATCTIQWDSDASGSYYLWIVVTGQGTGTCSNQRYREVVVTANAFNATIIALGTSTATEFPSWSGAPSVLNDCPEFSTGANFLYSSGDDGSSYVFFRVDVLAENGGTHTWNITSVLPATNLEYWNAGTSTWSGTAPTNISDDTNSILVRVTLDNLPAGQSLSEVLIATENIGANTVPDITSGDNTATIAINPMPDLGSATFN
jgi:hypothetical protein